MVSTKQSTLVGNLQRSSCCCHSHLFRESLIGKDWLNESLKYRMEGPENAGKSQRHRQHHIYAVKLFYTRCVLLYLCISLQADGLIKTGKMISMETWELRSLSMKIMETGKSEVALMVA